MTRQTIATLLLGLAIAICMITYGMATTAQSTNSTNASLYTRLCGYDALAAVTDDSLRGSQPTRNLVSFSSD